MNAACSASQSLRTGADQPAIVTESHNLSIFLGTQNKIRDGLKFSLNSIPGFEELLADVVNTCSLMFEERHYILPSEKHMLVKVSLLCYARMILPRQVLY